MVVLKNRFARSHNLALGRLQAGVAPDGERAIA